MRPTDTCLASLLPRTPCIPCCYCCCCCSCCQAQHQLGPHRAPRTSRSQGLHPQGRPCMRRARLRAGSRRWGAAMGGCAQALAASQLASTFGWWWEAGRPAGRRAGDEVGGGGGGGSGGALGTLQPRAAPWRGAALQREARPQWLGRAHRGPGAAHRLRAARASALLLVSRSEAGDELERGCGARTEWGRVGQAEAYGVPNSRGAIWRGWPRGLPATVWHATNTIQVADVRGTRCLSAGGYQWWLPLCLSARRLPPPAGCLPVPDWRRRQRPRRQRRACAAQKRKPKRN